MNWPEYTVELDKGLRKLVHAGSQAIRLWMARHRVRRPLTLQFPVNDICNAACVMCAVWKRKREREITPEELVRVLRSPFFREVRFVGLSGGEPTLRHDLPELGEALCTSLPRLAGLHIISNALRPRRVLESLRALAGVARKHGKALAVNISIDGIGAVHDEHRGRPGNFAAAVEVIRALRADGVPVGIGCTLTPLNCHHADDVLEWSEAEGIEPVYFRLGVEIRRLYNEGFRLSHPFSREQRFHLALFFEKLSAHPKIDALRRQVYRSLVGHIWEGAPRAAGCQWQDDGLTLDSRGCLSFCSVASGILGSALEGNPQALVRRNVGQRRRILRHCCSSCHHDLIGPLPPRVLAAEGWRTVSQPWKRDFALLREWTTAPAATRVLAQDPRRPGPSSWRSVLISGWYGTETAGDKAILGALFGFLRTHARHCQRITLCTLNRRVCEQTLHELGAGDVRLVPMEAGARSRIVGAADAVIVGGGPLFPIPPLRYIQAQFEEAARQRRARVLFGCGVGPLGGNGDIRPLARIVQLATAGFYRDEESRDRAVRFGGNPSLGVGFDPSLAYLRDWLAAHAGRDDANDPAGRRRIALLVRANTTEYIHDTSGVSLDNLNWMAAMQMAGALRAAGTRHPLEARLLPMHCLPVGGDDRLFNRRIATFDASPCLVQTERAYLPLSELLARLNACHLGLVMRYHGHMFSLALGKPFVSIDYSGGEGKVANLERRLGWGPLSVRWTGLQAADLGKRITRLLEEEAEWRQRIAQARDGFLGILGKAFADLAEI